MTEIQYITDANGHQIGVIVPIEVWEELESGNLKNRLNDLKRLFKRTQGFPAVKSVTDEVISKEIDDYRNGK